MRVGYIKEESESTYFQLKIINKKAMKIKIRRSLLVRQFVPFFQESIFIIEHIEVMIVYFIVLESLIDKVMI